MAGGMEHAIEKLEEHAQEYVNNAKLKVSPNLTNSIDASGMMQSRIITHS